jgi:transposase-like protein
MNELKNRGVQDILIFAVDNLKGISGAILAAFPQSEIQKCVVHQILNSLRKKIYAAATEEKEPSRRKTPL